MKRILICSTILTTIKSFLIPHIKMLQSIGYRVDVAAYKDVEGLEDIVDNIYDIPFNRNPFSKRNIIASRKLKDIVNNDHYDIIHFHTPVASAFGRWIVKDLRKNETKVFYTAHGFHFFKGAPLKNWLLYYPVERFLARYTDVLITINKEDYKIAHDFKAKKITYVPGVGVDTKKFRESFYDKKNKREELDISNETIVILSIGELIERKNHETALKAIAKVNNTNWIYLICGQGQLESHLKDLAKVLGIEEKVKFLGFRNDISQICKASDVFVFPSYQEGLPVAVMEAMSVGLPIVCSSIRGNTGLIEQGKGGYLVDPNDVDGFVDAINKIIENVKLRRDMGDYNKESVMKFDVDNVISDMKKIYSGM